MSNDQKTIVPEVGMGVTVPYGISGADCDPGTICEVVLVKSGPNKGKVAKIGVRMDRVEHITGYNRQGTEKVAIFPDADAPVRWYTLRNDGKWRMVQHNSRVSVGHRNYARDTHWD